MSYKNNKLALANLNSFHIGANKNFIKKMIRNYQLYLLVLPALLYFIIFHYVPMYGVQIAFKDFIATKGIMGSPWVGLENFQRFFQSHYFWVLIKNTLGLSLYTMIAAFPFPILLALMLNEARDGLFKRLVQTVTYAPHFISIVVLVGVMISFLSPVNGIVNNAIVNLGGQPVNFMTDPKWFKTLHVFSGIWQHTGWNAIIYLAALSGIDQQLHEACMMDGAGRLKRIWYINIPGILPTIIILLIMNTGSLMSVGFEKVFLMQNPPNMEASDVISTYVYRVGLVQAQYSFSAAVSFFNSVINFILLVLVNFIAKRTSETSLW